MDLDFLAGVQTPTSASNLGTDQFSAAEDSAVVEPSTAATALRPPNNRRLSHSPGHVKLSPAAGAFVRSLPDLSFMLAPPGMNEARE